MEVATETRKDGGLESTKRTTRHVLKARKRVEDKGKKPQKEEETAKDDSGGNSH